MAYFWPRIHSLQNLFAYKNFFLYNDGFDLWTNFRDHNPRSVILNSMFKLLQLYGMLLSFHHFVYSFSFFFFFEALLRFSVVFENNLSVSTHF